MKFLKQAAAMVTTAKDATMAAASTLGDKASAAYEGVTDAAGNRMTHPAVAFQEGAEAMVKAMDMRPSDAEAVFGKIENPYE